MFSERSNFPGRRCLFIGVGEPNAPEPTDGTLAVAAVLGNLDAFGELVRRYRRGSVRIAAGIAGMEAAEDIAQDALLIAFKALPDLDEPDRFAAWLYAITRNRALRWISREGRAVRVDFDDALLAYMAKVSAADVRDREAASDMVEGIEQLPEGLRMTMRLRWLDEMSMQQIGAFTGLPVSTVKWRLHEGKKRLREWLDLKGTKKETEHGKRERTRSRQAVERVETDGADGPPESVGGSARAGRWLQH